MFEKEIAKGIEVLNGFNSEWFLLIDLEELDIGSCSQCVLGQIWNSMYKLKRPNYAYDTAKRDLFNSNVDHSRNHGFTLTYEETTATCNMHILTTEWKEAIHELQEQHKINTSKSLSQESQENIKIQEMIGA